MYQFLLKKGQLVAFGLGILVVVLFMISIFSGLPEFQTLAKEDRGATSMFNVGLYGAIALTIICAIVAVLFGVFQAATNIKGSLFGIIGLAAIVGVWFVAYNMAQPETSGSIYETMAELGVSSEANKFVHGGLVTGMVIAAVAVLAFILGEVRNLFK